MNADETMHLLQSVPFTGALPFRLKLSSSVSADRPNRFRDVAETGRGQAIFGAPTEQF